MSVVTNSVQDDLLRALEQEARHRKSAGDLYAAGMFADAVDEIARQRDAALRALSQFDEDCSDRTVRLGYTRALRHIAGLPNREGSDAL